MKWRENFLVKALAFLLAVAAFTVCAIVVWYQIANVDALWIGGEAAHGYTSQYLVRRDAAEIRDLVGLYDARSEQGDGIGLAARQALERLEARYAAGTTNLRWQLLSQDGTVIYGNTQGEIGGSIAYWAEYERETPVSEPDPETGEQSFQTQTVSLVLWLDDALRVDDQYKKAADALERWQSGREILLTLAIVCGVAGLALAVYLCCGAGHKNGAEGITLNWFHRVPGDVLLILLFLCGAGALGLGVSGVMEAYGSFPMSLLQLGLGSAVAVAAACALGMLVTLCARAKARTLLRDTLVWKLCGWGWKLCGRLWRWLCALMDGTGRAIRAIPLIWKAVMGCMAYTLFAVTTFERGAGLWLLVTLCVSAYLCLWAYQWKKIRQGTQEIIGGNPGYHIDTRRMLPDLRGHADELNNLSHAISAAVDERVSSEHFKAELITNVSHDLKTPLTSIINYVDLLKKEDIDSPRAKEYIEVLDRKSQRLKKLTEDLVEASKASTGNLAVNWERLDWAQLTDQALAECGERLEAQNLTVVRSLPGKPLWVMADGRHLWRVLDNLLTNCAKYALPGTRVYVDLRRSGDWAVLSVKNISRDALDIPAERLMERFVRGDESRNTPGSGLGLSIAQSLTELQNGKFEIGIDGDLFKAIVTLPLAGEGGGPDAPIELIL